MSNKTTMSNNERIKELRTLIREYQEELDILEEDARLDKEEEVVAEFTMYTSGYCISNVASDNPPAGWAFVLVDAIENTVLETKHGTVVCRRDDVHYIGADNCSYDTACLSAIYHALVYLRDHVDVTDIVTICTHGIHDIHDEIKNKELVGKCKKVLEGVNCTLTWQSSSGGVHNDMVDNLAKEGAKKCYTGPPH